MKKFLFLVAIAGLVFGNSDELMKLKIENKILRVNLERCAIELNATRAEQESVVVTKNKREVTLNNNIIINDILEFDIVKNSFSKTLKPSKPKDYYRYFEAKGDEVTKFIAEMTVKNLNSENIDLNKAMNATLIYDGKFKYSLSLVIEELDGSNFEVSMMTKPIKPLIKTKVYIFTDVPLEVEVSNKSLILIIEIKDEVFEYKIR